MLLLDRYKPHLHYNFVNFCWKHKIIPYILSPHSTHLMQPLNIIVFQQVKHYHRKAIDKAVMLGATRFPVVEFFEAYSYVREQVFKRDIIISVFEKTGIYPYNPNKIVIPIREK